MKQCEWCGLVTSDEGVCTFCGHALDGGSPAVAKAAEPPGKAERRMRWFSAAFAIVLITGLFLIRTSPPASANPDAERQEDQAARQYGRSPSQRLAGLRSPVAPDQEETGVYVSGQPTKYRRENSNTAPVTAVPEEQAAEGQADDMAAMFFPETGYGSVSLSGTQLSVEAGDDGNDYGIGVVIIGNDGDYPILDYNLSMIVDGTVVPLQPADDIAIGIAPGEQVSVPFRVNLSLLPSIPQSAPQVRIEAAIDGPPGTVYGTAPLL